MKIEEKKSEHNQGLNWGPLYKKYGLKLFLPAILIALIAIYLAFFK
jgi:hypothetical protein